MVQLVLAHPWVLLPQRQDGLFLGRRPGRPPHPRGASRARFQPGQVITSIALQPAIDRRDRNREGERRIPNSAACRMLNTQEAELRLRAQARRLGQAALDPVRDAADDPEAAAGSACYAWS